MKSREVSKFTASQILVINTPEKLFTGPDSVDREYKELAKVWYEDKNPGVDPQVMAKINILKTIALTKVKDGSWDAEGAIQVETIDKKKYKIKYRRHRSFGLGDTYICDTVVAHLINKKEIDLVKRAKGIIGGFKFSSDRMKKEVSKYLPKITIDSETNTHVFVAYEKGSDFFSLRDVLEQQGGKLPAEHVAWIISSLYNLACYFKFTGICHNDISLDTYFISPKTHSGALLGGWWYATKVGEKLVAVPSRTFNYTPAAILKEKIGTYRIDSELIKATGRELLGDINGTKLVKDTSIPRPLFNWLQAPGGDDPVKDYETWSEKVLIDSFGKRRFVELKVADTDIYND